MNGGVAATVEGVGVVLLLAVIGQRLSGNLTSSDAAAVGEGGDEERVDSAFFLQDVEHRLDAFVDERNSADLDADHFFGLAFEAANAEEASAVLAAVPRNSRRV